MLSLLLAVAVSQVAPDGAVKVTPVKWSVECKTDEFTDARQCSLWSWPKAKGRDDAANAVKIFVSTKDPKPSIYFGKACADVARVDKNQAIEDSEIHFHPLKLIQQMLGGAVLRYRTNEAEGAGTFAVTLDGFPAAYAELFRKAGIPQPSLSETAQK